MSDKATSGIKAVGEADPLGSDAYATTPPGGLTDAESQLIFGNDVDVPAILPSLRAFSSNHIWL